MSRHSVVGRSAIATTSSTRKRYDLATKLGSGRWTTRAGARDSGSTPPARRAISQGSFPTLEITDEIARTLETS